MGFKANTDLLRSLEPGSETLRDLLENFLHVSKKHDYVIESFYEALDYGQLGKVSVMPIDNPFKLYRRRYIHAHTHPKAFRLFPNSRPF